MARPLRIEFPGAVYHVTSRGDRREEIYRDDADRREHLRVIALAMERFDARVLAYCLMGNHYHLVLQTAQANLSRLMRQVNGVYTQAFNRRHAVTGHLFQGRFKAVVVDRDAYLLTLCRYVERNPVAAGLVHAAADWPWSSCRAHVGADRVPAWLDTVTVLAAMLGRAPATEADARLAQRRYAAWVESVDERASFSWQQALRRQVFLGDEGFVARMQAHLPPPLRETAEIPKTQRSGAPLSLQECLDRAGERNRAIAMAYREGGMTMTAIARELGLSVARVSRVIQGVEAKVKT